MKKHCENALKVALFLEQRDQVKWVNYPGLNTHPCHGTAIAQFNGSGFGGMLSFGLEDQSACFEFINNLRLIRNLANLGDCKTLAIHPYSTQYVSFDEKTREELSITRDLIRLSVGIESVDDICDDIARALDKIN
jgi:O-acetylhomoserine (thiol)-lyase